MNLGELALIMYTAAVISSTLWYFNKQAGDLR